MSEINLWEIESELPFDLICGVDEAGRGPLCGPVCVAAVILPEKTVLPGLNDSKKLTEKKREALFPLIEKQAVCYSVVMIGPETIDALNILGATMLGMRRAVEGLRVAPSLALIDGNRCPQLPMDAEAVIGGDAKSASIAAASVLAKVTRDRYMRELDAAYPQYKLAKHKGYPTAEHYALLDTYGVAPFYRKSFLKKRGYV